jgi:hypothetical protein
MPKYSFQHPILKQPQLISITADQKFAYFKGLLDYKGIGGMSTAETF